MFKRIQIEDLIGSDVGNRLKIFARHNGITHRSMQIDDFRLAICANQTKKRKKEAHYQKCLHNRKWVTPVGAENLSNFIFFFHKLFAILGDFSEKILQKFV